MKGISFQYLTNYRSPCRYSIPPPPLSQAKSLINAVILWFMLLFDTGALCTAQYGTMI